MNQIKQEYCYNVLPHIQTYQIISVNSDFSLKPTLKKMFSSSDVLMICFFATVLFSFFVTCVYRLLFNKGLAANSSGQTQMNTTLHRLSL